MYILPPDRIAQNPVSPRDHAKLMLYEGGAIVDKHVYDMSSLLDEGQMIICNDTKVIKARIVLDDFRIIKKDGMEKQVPQGEIFVYDLWSGGDNEFEALVADGKHYRPGTRVFWSEDIVFESVAFTSQGILMRLHGMALTEFLEKYAQMPLPPYVDYDKKKEADYNTVFARASGSVAAPTASLHLTQEMMDSFASLYEMRYVTLHVGLGTFKPLASRVEDHEMHAERLHVSVSLFDNLARHALAGKDILAIGTTALRTIESLVYVWPSVLGQLGEEIWDPEVVRWWESRVRYDRNDDCISHLVIQGEGMDAHLDCATSLYVRPPYRLQVATQLMTNFHVPKTSLLVLVQTIMGYDNAQKAYEHALEHGYRFYSFGDAMLIKTK